MRVRIRLDPALLAEAREVTGIRDTTALVQEGLKALISHESSRSLARLGDTMPDLTPPPRRRFNES